MTIEHFNSLPIEARSFIENHAGCLACGRTEAKLDRAYQLYLNTKKMNVYTLFGGGINYATREGDAGVLYNIHPDDEPFKIREKIRIAKLINEVRPHSFSSFNEEEIEKLLASLPEEEVVQLGADRPKTTVSSTDVLEDKPFNVYNATYNELQSYAKDNGIKPDGKTKDDFIKAIKEHELL